MVLRSVIGALVAVGVMGAIAAALPERNAGRPVAAPKAQTFGTLPAPSTPAAATGDTTLDTTNRKALLTLASAPLTPDTMLPKTEPPRPSAPAQAPLAPPAPPAALVALAPEPKPAAPPAAPAPFEPPRSPRLLRRFPPPSPPVAVQPPPAADRSNSRININKASVEQLDHIPGGGRIGAWIARRRPYRSIEDLVNKRVLREAAFRRIRSAITVD